MTTAEIVIAAGVRTPQAKAGGAFRGEDAGRLGSFAVRELLARAGVEPGEVAEVVVGCVGPPQDQANVGRVIALRAGLPHSVPGVTVGRNCASGMEAVTYAAARIAAGRGELYVAAGVEVMSAYPLSFGPEMTALFERLSRARTLGARLAALASFRPRYL
jgi:acetyl-CoA C-acetyltransferase/acetyl-CoA acyltransferase